MSHRRIIAQAGWTWADDYSLDISGSGYALVSGMSWSGEMSMACWCYNTEGDYAYMVMGKNQGGGWVAGYPWIVNKNSSEQVQIRCGNNSAYVEYVANGWIDDAWTHLAVTRRSLGGNDWQFEAWVNGSSLGTQNRTLADPLALDSFKIGDQIAGNVDEMAWWGAPIVQADVNDIYNAGVPHDLREVDVANLLAYWPFEQTANDRSGNGHDGTLSGDATYTEDTP